MTIAQVDWATGGGGTPPAPTPYNVACAIGDVLVCHVRSLSGTSPGTVTVFDNVNSGNYTFLNASLDAASASWLGIFFKVANAAGTPTVSCTESAAQFGQLDIARYNGFTGIPTADASMTGAPFAFTGTGTAVSCSPITSNFNTELLLTAQFRAAGGYVGGTIPGWTAADGLTFGSPFYYAVEASSGTTNNFAGTLGTSQSWNSVFAGIYDAPASLPLGVRQACVGFSGNTVVGFQTGSFAAPTLAGSTIFVVTTGNSGGGQQTFADAINGAYTPLDTVIDVAELTRLQSFMFQNAASIGTAQVLTVTPASGAKLLGFIAYEIQGIPGASLAAHVGGLQTLATAAANAIATPTIQAGIGAAIAIAVCQNTSDQNTTFAPTVGTGYALCPSPGDNFWPFSAKNMATGEFQTLTNPQGMNATFTPPGPSSDNYATFIAVFNSIGGAFVPPFTQTQFFVNDQYIQM